MASFFGFPQAANGSVSYRISRLPHYCDLDGGVWSKPLFWSSLWREVSFLRGTM